MKVKNWMVKELVTISPESSIEEAIQLMKVHAIRHLPVVKEGQMVGFITESDIRQFLFPAMVSKMNIGDVMIKDPITISPDDSVEEAARIIYRHKIGGLPVVTNEGKLVGIITVTDLLAAFVELMGLLRQSSRIDVIPATKEGSFEEIVQIIRSFGVEIISIGMDTQPPFEKVHYIRLETCDLRPIVSALEEAGHRVISVLE